MEDEKIDNNLENKKDINMDIPNKDYELLTNTVIHLVNI